MTQIAAQSNGHSVTGDLPQIALARTVPPALSGFAVERSRLLAVLDHAASRRLILFKAPAGYGKTTLAAAWCHRLGESGAVVAWLTMDEDDNEPSTFAFHLAKAIERVSPNFSREAIELLQTSSLIPARNVLSALVNAASESERETFLLLDDFQVLTDPRCLDLMTFLLRYAPSNLHIAIISRAEPRLLLSKLRLQDDFVEIDAALLRFDLDETKQFLGSDLTNRLRASGVAKLYSATEGWPAALQLARISLRNFADPAAHIRTFSGTSRSIAEYLEDTLASEPDEIVWFLLQTSILDQMNGPLCEAVTGMPQSAELLATLDRQQLLLMRLDDDGLCYRYHPLMREFLRDRLHARSSHQASELHRRAYRWYASNEMWTEAVQHAFDAKDFDRALNFVENCAMSLVVKGDLLTLLSWERQLPAELMQGQCEVKLALAWGMALVTRFKEANDLLSRVERAAGTEMGSDLWWRCRAARAVLYALGDDSGRARDMALECLKNHSFDPFNFDALCNVTRYGHMKAGDWDAFYTVSKPELSAGEASYALAENYRLCLHGIAAAQQLQCDEALRFYTEARLVAEKHVGPKSVPATMVTGLIAAIRYERGDISGAEVSVLDEFDLIETTAFHESFLQAILVLVRAALGRGDTHRAASLLNRSERLCWERRWGRVVAALLVERTRLLLAEKNVGEALSLLQAFEQLSSDYPAKSASSWSAIPTYTMIAKGLLASATGHADDAVVLLGCAYGDLLAANDRLAALRVGADLAIAHSHSGSPAKALGVLKQLLEWAVDANVVGFVLDRHDAIYRLLSQARENGAFGGDGRLRTFVADLIARGSERDGTARKPVRASQRGLTERERSIIEYIATGQSNKQIARELGVAPETIKTHLKRIFQKLSAETRAQAVVRAQSLGILGRVDFSIPARSETKAHS